MKNEHHLSPNPINKPALGQWMRNAELNRSAANKDKYAAYASACAYLTTIILENKKDQKK